MPVSAATPAASRRPAAEHKQLPKSSADDAQLAPVALPVPAPEITAPVAATIDDAVNSEAPELAPKPAASPEAEKASADIALPP
ncbi:MAG: hypothetical protein WDO73_04755 [Ignavibacteriota bacterium]